MLGVGVELCVGGAGVAVERVVAGVRGDGGPGALVVRCTGRGRGGGRCGGG